MANYKVAYGRKDNISYAIEKEVIPPGCIILTEDSDEIYFYDLNRRLTAYKKKDTFTSREEAEEWLEQYECFGQIFSIHEEDHCSLYVVNYENKLEKVESGTPCKEFIQEMPSKKWDITHDLNSYPTVVTTDLLGNTIVGETIYIDTNRLVVNFSENVSGKAYIK